MDICFYDNTELSVNEKGIVSVDRVYCLNFNGFIASTWEQLKQVYLVLSRINSAGPVNLVILSFNGWRRQTISKLKGLAVICEMGR